MNGQDEEITQLERERLTQLRQDIDSAAAHLPRLYTEPARAMATGILAVMLDAAGDYGLTRDDFDEVIDLPHACIEVVESVYRPTRPSRAEDVAALLEVVRLRLTELGQPGVMELTISGVVLPRLDTTPTRHRLAISLSTEPVGTYPDTGWGLYVRVLDDVPGTVPLTSIMAPFDEEGARAVADLVAAINRGDRWARLEEL